MTIWPSPKPEPKPEKERKQLKRSWIVSTKPPKPLKRSWLKRSATAIKKIGKFAKKRAAKLQAFYRSKTWKEQRLRVFQRDGFRCTEMRPLSIGGEIVLVRCTYTASDGPLHAAHKRYSSPIEKTPDKDIATKCPKHHHEEHPWRTVRAIAVASSK